jgi:uncharacterized lipoprotein YajG
VKLQFINTFNVLLDIVDPVFSFSDQRRRIMKQYNSFVFVRFEIIVLFVSLSLWGCGPWHITPAEIKADSPKDSLLAGVSVALKNAETDSSEYNIINMQNRSDTSFRTNKRECIDMVMKGLNKGLNDRGARVVEEAPHVVTLTIQEMAHKVVGVGITKYYSTVNVTVGSRWKKAYQGEGASSSWGFGGVSSKMATALDRSLSDVVTNILTDEEFLSALKTGK